MAHATQLESTARIFDVKFDVALDISGSTGSRVVGDYKGIILEAECDLVRAVLGFKDHSVIAWDTTSSHVCLSKLVPRGGTSPVCLFSTLNQDVKTLFIMTDGEVDNGAVQMCIPKVQASNLINVVAVFVGGRNQPPSRLNLPVFAPFVQNVAGQVLVCHYDGITLKLLIKSCQSSVPSEVLPITPSEINDSTNWSDFPTLDPQCLLSVEFNPEKAERSRKALNDPRLYCNGFYWDLQKMSGDIELVFQNAKPEDVRAHVTLLEALIYEFIAVVRTDAQRDSLRKILQIWYKFAHRVATEDIDKLTKDEFISHLRKETDEIYEKIKTSSSEEAKFLREKLSKNTRQLFVLDERLRKATKDATSTVSHTYNTLVAQLAPNNSHQDYSLASIAKSLGSNRANRARTAKQNAVSHDVWDFEGAVTKECAICNDVAPVALLPSVLNDYEIADNTSDYSLNDAFSLGFNVKNLPTETVCVYCASFLISQTKPCPFTRNKISTYLPAVKHSESNFALLCGNLSHWLFGGKILNIEVQAFLSVLDALKEVRGAAELADFFFKELVPATRANFEGLLGQSKPLLEAIKDIFATTFSRHEAETFLKPLRNKNLASLSAIGRIGMMFGVAKLQQVQVLLQRMLIKNVVCKIQAKCKERDSYALVQIAIEQDLFECTVGFPIRHSGRILGNVTSSFLLEDVGYNMKDFENSLFSPSLAALSAVFYIVYSNVHGFRVSSEQFICNLFRSDMFKDCIEDAVNLGNREKEVVDLINSFHQCVGELDGQHRSFASYSPATLISATILCCGCCGLAFISATEVHACLEDYSKAKQVAELVKDRRARHFQKYFKSDSPTGMVTSNSAISNIQRAVVMVSKEVENLLSRETLIKVLKRLRREYKGGDLFDRNLMHYIATYLADLNTKLLNHSIQMDPNSSLAEKLKVEIQYLKTNNFLPPKNTLTSEEFTAKCRSESYEAFYAKTLWKPMYDLDQHMKFDQDFLAPVKAQDLISA